MSTDRQIEANRRNAQNSTGPTTIVGKELSSMNATTHGAYATRPIAIQDGPLAEDQEQLDDFVNSLIATLRPKGSLEHEQARHVAMSYVRLRRLMRLEELGYAQPLTIHELIAHTDLMCTIDARIAARLSKALSDYKALVDNRPVKGPLATWAAELAEALENGSPPWTSRELNPAEPTQPPAEGPQPSPRETNPIVDTA